MDQKAKPLSSDPVVQIKLNRMQLLLQYDETVKYYFFFFIGKTLSHGGSL